MTTSISSEAFEKKPEIPVEFSSKKILKSVHRQGNWTSGPESDLRESTISDLESPSNFQVKEKKFIEIGPEITKLCLY